MIREEKLNKVSHDFSLLNEEQQDYILGILQALVFANNSNNHSESENAESVSGSQNNGQDL
jgi:hypothetical protein